MKNVVRYVIGNTDYEIRLPSVHEAHLEAWSDVDWTRDHHKRLLLSGYVITVAEGPAV